MDEADVYRGGANVFGDGQVELEQAAEDFDELVDGRFAELGVGGVGHGAGGTEDGTQGAFRGNGEAVFRGLAVDEEAAAPGALVGDLGAG